MADFAFFVLWALAFSALHMISLAWVEIKRLKETVPTIKALEGFEQSIIIKDLEKLEGVSRNARDLLDEIRLWSQGSAGRKLCRFFSSSNPLLFCFRIGHRIKKMREQIDEIAAERDMSERLVEGHVGVPVGEIRVSVSGIIARIHELNDNKTSSFIPASEVIGFDEDRAKPIVYIVACIVGVCVDPFFLYIPFLSHTKMCLGMNTELWKVAVALRTIADFFTALILFMSIDRPQISRCMSSIKLILLMCMKYLVFAPIPQILFSEKFILKTLGGYTFWNLILFCHYGARLVLIFQSCEQLKRRLSGVTWTDQFSLFWFNVPVYLFLYFTVSHVIGASWYYLSIKRQLSCWNYACKINTGCIFHCDGTTTSTLNSTLYDQFCPINPPNATVFDYGIYLDALQSLIVEEGGVLKKCLRCFFWGLRNLSSFALNVHTSTNGGETFFAIIISAVALILLIYMQVSISIQRYSELESARSERKMESIKELIKCLVEFHNPEHRRIKFNMEHFKFENGYRSYSFLNDVAKKKSFLKVLGLQDKDEEWFKRMSSRLKEFVYSKECCIFRFGEPLNLIIFIREGIIATSTDDGGSINYLKKGDLFGGELLQWKLDNIRELGSSAPIPTSTADVKSHTRVEAFVLEIEDLNIVI